VQTEGTTLSNHGDFVDRVLAEVARLSRDGAYADALGSIDKALEQEEAERRARRTRLIGAAVEQGSSPATTPAWPRGWCNRPRQRGVPASMTSAPCGTSGTSEAATPG
jgi:hypothetical protein